MPGSGKQPQEVQARIKELLEAGFDPTSIHKKLNVGRSSIYRMKRSLQQYGSAYAPPETNKKNGRPKVLTAEQELVIRDWLRVPENRNRYLDDLVWYIHDKFGVVCSTTTVSKMKRKWLRVIEDAERSGTELRAIILPDAAFHESRPASDPGALEDDVVFQSQYPHSHLVGMHPRPAFALSADPSYPLPSSSPADMNIEPDLQQQASPTAQLSFDPNTSIAQGLQHRLQQEIAASAAASNG